LVSSSTKWQEGIECCREIWTNPEENPFRKMFKEQADVLPGERKLRAVRELEDAPDSDEEKPPEDEDDDPDGLCDADIKQFGDGSAVFGVVRFGVEMPPEVQEPKCLNCGSKGKHLQRCSTWKPLPEGETCVYFCCRDCQKEAWKSLKSRPTSAA